MKLRILPWILLAASVITFCTYSYLKIPKLTYGFAAYYTSSRIILEGEDYSKSYNFDYFNSKIKEFGFSNIQDMPNNLPTTSFVMLPVAWLSPAAAKIVWGVVSVLLYILSVIILLKVFDIKFSGKSGLIFLSLSLLFYPAYQNISLGQIYILLLFLFAASMYFIKLNKNIPAAFAVSLAVVFKGYGLLVSLWFLMQKKPKALLAAALFVLLIIFAGIPVLGFESWKAYFNAVPSALLQNTFSSVTTYQNISGFLKHLFTFEQQWSPYPLVNLPSETVFIFTGVITLCIIYLFLKNNNDIKNKSALILLSYSAILGVSVITAPLAEEYHYVLFLPLIAGLVKVLFEDFTNFKQLKTLHVVFITAVIIMALPLDYRSLQNSQFPVYLLAYPKLYSGAAMLTVYLFYKRNLHEVSALN